MRLFLMVFLLSSLSVTLIACGDDTPPQPARQAPAAQQAPTPQPQAAEVEEEEEEVIPRYSYDSSIRDPFRPVDLGPEQSARPDCGPLCNYNVAQFRLIGIVWGIAEPVAMLRAPDGKPYIAKQGMPIGKNNGNIVSIANDRVVVLEKYVNYRGEVVTNRVYIELPTEGGNRR